MINVTVQPLYNSKSDATKYVTIDISISNTDLGIAEDWEKALCRVKEMLSQLEAKPKIWDQKEENPVVPQEQESSTHSNDQRLPEKGQLQKIVRTNKKQYLVSYGSGLDTEAVNNLLQELEDGKSVYYPDTLTVQVIDL